MINVEIKKYEITDDSNYLFTCAELTSREFEFLDNLKLERLVNSKNTDEFLKVLQETVYSSNIALINDESNLDNFILKYYKEMVDFLVERLEINHFSIIYLLFIEEYLNDFKLILKSLLLNNINLENLFIPLTFSYENLMEFMKKESPSLINEKDIFFQKIISELFNIKTIAMSEENYKQENIINFRKIEISFEKKFIEILLEEIKKIKSQMLLDYFKHWIDIQNIKNMNRVKYSEENLKYLDYLYPGGFIDINLFKILQSESSDYQVKEFEESCYSDIVIKGVHSLFSYKTFFSFDKNETLFYLRFFDSIKYSVSNVVKIFSFFLRKKIEIIVLNMIYMGIKYNAQKRNIIHKAEFLSES